MLNGLRNILRRNPRLHDIASKIYKSYLYIRIKTEKTKFYEKEWSMRHNKEKSDWGYLYCRDSWVMDYWESRNHPHREFLIKNILKFAPIESILEVGSNCGPNLYLLAKYLPSAKLIGIDINPLAIKLGNELFKKEGVYNVKLMCLKADELGMFKDKCFDVVFTDAVLIYVGPDKIGQVLGNFIRLAKKAVILLEWHLFQKEPQTRKTDCIKNEKWVRDYNAILKNYPVRRIEITKIPEKLWPDPNWGKYGALIIIYLE
jgi:ubiquinone/menaquinone biosynthesis C-methylase UbiE